MSTVLSWITSHWGVICFALLFILSELKGELQNSKYGSILYGPIRDYLRGEATQAKPKVDQLVENTLKN